MKSFYVLELSTDPGGVRKGFFFVYDSLEPIKRELELDLRLDLQSGWGIVCCYGERVTLLTYSNGQEQQRIDLRPFITIVGADGTIFTPDEADDRACDEDFIRSARASVNWDSIPVMALSGDRLQPGECAEVYGIYGSTVETLYYGFNDCENGMSEEEYRQSIAEFEETEGAG